MTRRLYYDDSYLTRFRAAVVEASPDRKRVVLDGSAFYPTSGGQPFDLGSINGIRVTDVIDEGVHVVHYLEKPLEGDTVEGEIDWTRRFDHMQQHTGQHLLSAVLAELFKFETVSFHLGAESSTIDLETPAISAAQIQAVERRVNELIFENRPVDVTYIDASEAADLRKASERSGTLRVVSIRDLDRSACGGTHVRATGEIGAALLRKTDKVRGNVRLEFLCGGRAVGRARADFDALTKIAQAFSCPLDDAPALVAAQLDRIQESEKARRKLAVELAQHRGRQLYEQAEAGADGMRRYVTRIAHGGIPDEIRTEAQSFTSQPKAIYAAVCADPASILLAASADSGVHAGNLLKAELQKAGGRGGGNAQLAQGSAPEVAALDGLLASLQISS
jgi:alanyl-tRNA synthetase